MQPNSAPRARRVQCLRGLLATALVVLTAAAPAQADGGNSIASATPVTFGQQEFGNTANGSRAYSDGCGTTYRSWWSLSVMAGDRVVIDWEAQQPDYTQLSLYPIGTSDYNLDHTSSKAFQRSGSNGKNELVYTVASTGTMPLALRACGRAGGPYAFTAFVSHGLLLSFPHVSRVRRNSTLRIGVHNPDGAPLGDPGLVVGIEIKSKNKWKLVGGSRVRNGVAAPQIRLSRKLRGKRVRLRAIGGGPGYTPAVSRSAVVRVR